MVECVCCCEDINTTGATLRCNKCKFQIHLSCWFQLMSNKCVHCRQEIVAEGAGDFTKAAEDVLKIVNLMRTMLQDPEINT